MASHRFVAGCVQPTTSLQLSARCITLVHVGIYTAAMAMLGGGSEVKSQCRKVEIMSDAAYAILTKDSRSFTGNFVIDDEILQQEGVTDFKQYNFVESKIFHNDL